MNFEYKIHFTVRFTHRYFIDSKLNCMKVVPDSESAGLMVNNGLLFKSFDNGFHILYDTSLAAKTRTRNEAIEGVALLRFSVTLTDSLFFNYTGLDAKNLATSVVYFCNVDYIKDKEEKIVSEIKNPPGSLHKNDFVSAEDLRDAKDVAPEYFVKPFGIIDISLEQNMPDNFSISFLEKSTYWRYLVVSDHLRALNEPAIICGEEVLIGPGKMMLPNNSEAIVFESENPIGIFQKTKKVFQLVENFDKATLKGKIVLRALPVPDIKVISYLNKEESKKDIEFSEIMIY